MNKTNEKMRTVLVGIAGSNNAFSLSLYNLKAFAYKDSEIRKDWDIKVIQSPLIGLFRRDKLLSDLTDKIVSYEPNLVGFSCYMWNIEGFLKIAKKLKKRLPDLRILLGGPEIATEYVQQSYFDKQAVDYCISGEGELTFLELLQHLQSRKPALKNIPGLAYRSQKNLPFTVNIKRIPFKSLS
ncbi:uncharacterized protein METZ01_LOCUS373617, partial [marine metagenome]